MDSSVDVCDLMIRILCKPCSDRACAEDDGQGDGPWSHSKLMDCIRTKVRIKDNSKRVVIEGPCVAPHLETVKPEPPGPMARTLTIFRKYRNGDIIALFPEMAGAPGLCWSYMHVGQHSSADYDLVIRKTKRATAQESADLRKELESIDYKLRVMQKWVRRTK